VLHKGAFSGCVALVHASDLRDRDVGLIDHQEKVLRKVVQQAGGCGSRGTTIDVAGVVLDTGAGADLAHHLDVVAGAHPQPLCLQELVLGFQVL